MAGVLIKFLSLSFVQLPAADEINSGHALFPLRLSRRATTAARSRTRHFFVSSAIQPHSSLVDLIGRVREEMSLLLLSQELSIDR